MDNWADLVQIFKAWDKWIGFLVGVAGVVVAMPSLKDRFITQVQKPLDNLLQARRRRELKAIYTQIRPMIATQIDNTLADHEQVIYEQKISLKHLMAENDQFKTYMHATVSKLQQTVEDMAGQATQTNELISKMNNILERKLEK